MSAKPPRVTPTEKYGTGTKPATYDGPLPFLCRKCGRLVNEARIVVMTGQKHECKTGA